MEGNLLVGVVLVAVKIFINFKKSNVHMKNVRNILVGVVVVANFESGI
jgi:hypothetical protein